ncbi:hypothetical protein H0H87_008172 [Tephrocybe sp. NHM501043]|nr:hypothetical protein H0H87_008172 [Tephrocybe sp. NHM501043]
MVNVGSQIPFNLHNQTLPPEVNHSLSRNASDYLDYFDSNDDYGYGNARTNHRQQPYPPDPYPRFTTSVSPERSSTRSKSIEREPPTPILNVRLVGAVDRRGRTMRRNPPDAVMDSGASESTPTQSKLPQLSNASPDTFKLHEAGAISFSWGD